MDIVPTFLEGAIVFNIVEPCKIEKDSCEKCSCFPLLFHNWVKEAGLSYLVFDFQDENKLCKVFLEELVNIRKRLPIPVLFAGVADSTKEFIESYNCNYDYPVFSLPEDAIRALRMQHPGLTERMPTIPIPFDAMLSQFFLFESAGEGGAGERETTSRV